MRTSRRTSVVLILPVLLTGVLAARQSPQPNQAPQQLHQLFPNVYCGWRDCGLRGPAENRAVRFADNTSVPLTNASATRVRYAWGGSPVCPLTDGSGLPAGPFEIAIRRASDGM